MTYSDIQNFISFLSQIIGLFLFPIMLFAITGKLLQPKHDHKNG